MNPRCVAIACSIALVALLLEGCVNLAPDYERPAAPVPSDWPTVGGRFAYPRTGDTQPAADLGWQQFLRDTRLRRAVALALENNRDLRQATLAIETARQRYRVAGATLFPAVDASASASFSRDTGNDSSNVSSGNNTISGNIADRPNVDKSAAVELGFASFELDFFGALRNDKQAALEALRSSAQMRESAQISLVGQTAIDWLTLAASRRRLALARQSLSNQRENLKLVRKRHDYGVASGSDVANARSTVETARGDVARFTTQVAQNRNALRLVAGTALPDALLPPVGVPDSAVLDHLPAGIPAAVLLQRPDVRAAEYVLRADNADIGAARAAFFPTVSLTASTGWATRGLSGLFSERNRTWRFSPRITLPIFDAGANRANLEISKTQKRIDLAGYEQTIQTAFREVADALAVRATVDEQLAAQRALVTANRRAYELSLARYRVGTDSYLDTLVAQRALYAARLTLVDRRLSAQNNLVTLYKVLGGGAVAESVAPNPAQTDTGEKTSGT